MIDGLGNIGQGKCKWTKSVDNNDKSDIMSTDIYYAGLFGKKKSHKGRINKKRFEKVGQDFFESLSKLSSMETSEQAACNANKKDYKDNCQRSVPVWELRMRGFDVIAAEPTNQDVRGYYAHKIFCDTVWSACETDNPCEEIEKFLLEQGNGSRVENVAYSRIDTADFSDLIKECIELEV